MSELRKVAIAELRDFITDADELKKGTEIADKGGLAHLAQHGAKLFADAAGSGAAPYKAQIVFGEAKVSGRCSCMAARSRPFCKHAAALLVSWARTPEAFVVAEAPPALAPGAPGAKKASVKRSKVDSHETLQRGVDQAATLLSELWQTGILALAADRVAQVAELGASLRELGLRRLSARMLELSKLLGVAARRTDAFPQEAYAELFADMWLTVRKLEKHLAGEALANEHVEELIGRTWTKKDRTDAGPLHLVEYAFLSETTVDGFVLRESRLFDSETGKHYSEKQILPAMIAKRVDPKPSYAGYLLHEASGNLYPSFAPQRVDIETEGTKAELSQSVLATIVQKALPAVADALTALAERRRDVFAPPLVPVLMQIHRVIPTQGRIRLVDAAGNSVFLARGRDSEDALMAALVGNEAVAVFGDLGLDGALPTFTALAVVAKRDAELSIVPLATHAHDVAAGGAAHAPSSWANDARAAGASGGALMLGEVRDDLGTIFQEGAGGVSARFIDPLASRLRDMQFAKQADALVALVGSDATAALDGTVKLYQVLGIALTRLASANYTSDVPLV
jgi:hypothetical protein